MKDQENDFDNFNNNAYDEASENENVSTSTDGGINDSYFER